MRLVRQYRHNPPLNLPTQDGLRLLERRQRGPRLADAGGQFAEAARGGRK
ncbi:MAG: hypothetical protein WBP81_26785 [Solirubrobacteraceae bacterium]